MTTLPFSALAELARRRGTTVLAYCAREQPPKLLAAGDVEILHQALRALGRGQRLDFILQTDGGLVTVGHRIARLLRDYASRLTIFLPSRARSSGTLICLAADELVFGPLGELSPLDPFIRSGKEMAEGPPGIYAEDIRAFPAMAREWFGLKSEASRLQALSLLSQKIFPTTLSSFYRSDRYVRKVAQELLAHQLPKAGAARRARIVDQLIRAYPDHAHGVTLAEARQIGLRGRAASAEEEPLLEAIFRACRSFLDHPPAVAPAAAAVRSARAVVLRPGFAAQFVVSSFPRRTGQPPPPSDPGRWEIIEHGR